MQLLPPALAPSREPPDGIGADSNIHPLGCRFGHVLMFVAFSFWVPQIIYCAVTDARQPLGALYMWGMSVTRLALPLYLLTCPHNLLRIEPRPVAGTLLVLWVAAQVGGADWVQSAWSLDQRTCVFHRLAAYGLVLLAPLAGTWCVHLVEAGLLPLSWVSLACVLYIWAIMLAMLASCWGCCGSTFGLVGCPIRSFCLPEHKVVRLPPMCKCQA